MLIARDTMKLATALLFFSALGIAGQAMAQRTEAATLQEFNGKVLVNKGNGLVFVKPGTALADGDRIVTLDKSGASIVFSDGCAVTLDENKIFVINAELGCKALPVSTEATAGLTTGQMGLIGVGVVALGAALAGGGGGGGGGNDNVPISNQ
jgi:hypothetical protein